jgi:hypothetical protein
VLPTRSVSKHQKVTPSAAVCLDTKKSITNPVAGLAMILLLSMLIVVKKTGVTLMPNALTTVNKIDIVVNV